VPESDTQDRPNLVFILPDRLRRDSMACYGNDWIQSPRLNELAAQSFVFENAYVAQPVCAPSRSCIMTGMYPHSTGAMVNPAILPNDAQTIASLVPDEYRTGYFGRWHLGDELKSQHGFDEWVSCFDGNWHQYSNPQDWFRFSDYHQFLEESGFTPDQNHPGGKHFGLQLPARVPPEFHMASYLGGQAAEFIDSCGDDPYVLYISTLEPHPPFTGPYDGLYDPATIPLEESFLRYPDGASLLHRRRADFYRANIRDGEDLRSDDSWRRLRAQYWGNVKFVDDMVGVILDAVDRSGTADRTVVVFTTDHGEMIGSHGLMEMRTPYEEASRVPLLIRVPWLQTAGSRVAGNISHVDLVPTLLDLLGQPVPENVQGSSRLGVMDGADTLEDNDVFVQQNGVRDRDLTIEPDSHSWPRGEAADLTYLTTLPWRSVITSDRWKLTLYVGDQCELYNLSDDPSELENLFDRPEHQDRVIRMTARLRQWQKEFGDSAPLTVVN
jgi:arylsulfatase A-like enzyme